ncbi:MAG: recombinase zinc beta ribbon domain-containing protein [Chloroflexi bacterium]|nr:recombinase zinc beta ribbon domain-containing protein [Chloroflexota bacterium]
MGIRLIVRHLNEQHIATRKGRNWSMVTIRDILRNRAYLGTYTRFGMKVPGSHPAIVTPDMFRWAQTRLDERKPKRKNGHAEPFVLSGLIYCGACNNRMVGVTRKQAWTRRKDGTRAEKQYRYYQCQSRTNQSICQYHTRRASDLESAVLDHLKTERPRIATLKGRKAHSSQALAKERAKIEASRRSADRRLRQTFQAIAAPGANRDALRKHALSLIRARRHHDDQLAALERQSSDSTEALGARAAAAIDKLTAEWTTTDLDCKRNGLEALVEAITVYDDRVNIKLRVG